jgi:spermidine synthase
MNGTGYDAVLFGQASPTRIDLDEWQSRLLRNDHARVKQSLKDAGFDSVVALLATYAGQASDLHEWMRDAQINTDRNLRLQYLAGMWLNSFEGSKILNEITRYYRFPGNLFTGTAARLQPLKEAIEKSRQPERLSKSQ